MKKIITRSIVLLAIVALVFGSLPTDSAQAAKKKSKTSITVSTQEELVKALKSGKYKKITIKTDAKVSFTLAAKYSSSDLKIVVDAKNATFNSKGTVGSIVVNEAKTVKEYASGNNITVNDEKLTFKAMEGASVEKLKIASETGEVKVVNNGDIGRVDVTGESKVDVEQNGSVGRLYVAAAAEIGVTGTSEEKLAVTVKPEAAGAAVKSELPVKVNAYADVDLQLEKGAENSAVTLKNEDAGVKLENNTDKKVTVTDSDGEKQTVKKGEDLTSDNYVGKPDEPETTDGTVTEQPKEEEQKEEEKKEEEKEEEKKDDTTSTGSTDGESSGGSSPNAVDPLRQLESSLAKAGDSYETAAALSADIIAGTSITIPSGKHLKLNGHTLNMRSNQLILEPDAVIYLDMGGKLYVEEKNIILGEDDEGHCWSEISLGSGCEFKIGDYSFTAEADEDDYDCAGRIDLEKKQEWRWDDQARKDVLWSNVFEVNICVRGKAIRIEGSNNKGADGIPAAFVEDAVWTGVAPEFDSIAKGVDFRIVKTSIDINVRYDTQVITFGNNNEVLIDHVNEKVDWLNLIMSSDEHNQELVENALAKGKTLPEGITIDPSDKKHVIVSDDTLVINKNLFMCPGATLTAKNIKIVFRENQKVPENQRSIYFDRENYDPACISVAGDEYYWDEENNGIPVNPQKVNNAASLVITGITTDITGFDHPLLNVRGTGTSVKIGDITYTVQSSQDRLKYDCWRTVYKYRYNAGGDCSIELNKDRELQFDLYKAESGGEPLKVIEHPFKGLVTENQQGNLTTAANRDELLAVLDWAEGVSWGYLEKYYNNNENAENISYAGLNSKQFSDLVWESFTAQSAEQIKFAPYTDPRDNNKTKNWFDLTAIDLSIAAPSSSSYDTLTIAKEANVNVIKGATLIVPTVGVNEGNQGGGKALSLEYDISNPQRCARVNVYRGGALQIGNIKMFIPDTWSGMNAIGEPALSLSAEYDNDNSTSSLRLQVPECTVFTKVYNGTETTPSINEINSALAGIHVNIAYESAIDPQYKRVSDDGEEYYEEPDDVKIAREEKDREHLGNINLDNDYVIVKYNPPGTPNVFALAHVPTKVDGYYQVTTREELIAVYLGVQTEGFNNGDPVKVLLKVDDANLDNMSSGHEIILDSNLDAMWEILVPNEMKFVINSGSSLGAKVTVASGGAIDVQTFEDRYGQLLTGMGGDITVKSGGALRVHGDCDDCKNNHGCVEASVKAKLVSRMGGAVVLEQGASFELNGSFECGVVGGDNARILFMNNENDIDSSDGEIILYPDVETPDYVISDADINTVKTLIKNQNKPDVRRQEP